MGKIDYQNWLLSEYPELRSPEKHWPFISPVIFKFSHFIDNLEELISNSIYENTITPSIESFYTGNPFLDYSTNYLKRPVFYQANLLFKNDITKYLVKRWIDNAKVLIKIGKINGPLIDHILLPPSDERLRKIWGITNS